MSKAEKVIFKDFTYTDTTDTLAGYIDANARITSIEVNVSTAFNAGTTHVVDIGISSDIDAYVDGADLSSAGVVTVTPVASSDYINRAVIDDDAPTGIYFKVIESGTAATAGAGVLTIKYAQD